MNKNKIRVLVNGACGRMGQSVVKAVLDESDTLELVGAVDLMKRDDAAELIGLPACGVPVTQNLTETIAQVHPDVMVDFTRPDVVFQSACIALENKVAPVIGTTGLSQEEKEKIGELAKKFDTPAFIAPNFAVGAVLMMQMAKQAAKFMPHVEIIELHHDKKLDAPSGTALQTAELIKTVRKSMKQGHPNEVEKLQGVRGGDVDGIKIHSVRLPGYVACQEVIFGGLGQTLTIRHDTTDRTSFMPGVILVCQKILERKGLVIGLENFLE